jgi:quercetin dioxygenase-like cupin family protein
VNAQIESPTSAQAFVRCAGEGEAMDAPAGRVTSIAKGTQTGGALTFFETVAASGDGPPHHAHVSEDEFIYVLEGRLRVRLVDTIHAAPAGAFVFIPKGVPHTWQVVGAGHARFVFGFAPSAAGMEGFFEGAAELPPETRLIDAFDRLAARAGVRVLGPPLARSHPAPIGAAAGQATCEPRV